ncbi:S-adenosylmethionine decarboxylase proenzyme [Marivirga lumbricoides]|uniref:Adenosylmethionine decarboxylase n=1 Tax=Marivirga lumbricoides TaxID=1046115 RepID=A0A2T4DR46_9BACT|nr:adenosylmethionine decarboxylase [Marivirga lumbricoides]GGC26438.1 S-adenosylmethionine decarboxylase proenzyme [Marivirga lumbricoides]
MIGYHTIWDIFECNPNSISFTNSVKELLNDIVAELNLSKVSESYKQFEPVGATGFILLEESHISIHTWPEHGFAAIDVFSCKSFNTEKINDIIHAALGTKNISVKTIERGVSFEHKVLK